MTKKNNKKKVLSKKEFCLLIIALLVLVSSLINLIIFNINNSNKVTVYYRTYTKENGWTKWSKNGETSGNKKDNITNIQVKAKTNKKGLIGYRLYNSKIKWSDSYSYLDKIKAQTINGVKIGSTEDIYKKFDVCYRTYNGKNKWLEWTCNGFPSGNKKENIKAIEIMVLKKDSLKYDYLKNYNGSNNESSIDLQEEVKYEE